VTISDTSGSCACLEGLSFPITQGGEQGQWLGGSVSDCDGCGVGVAVSCNGGNWSLDGFLAASTKTLVSASCSPFQVVFAVSGILECCNGGCTVTLTK
jgi:hypothetical protein